MDPDPGGPKTCGSGFGSGSATLRKTLKFQLAGSNFSKDSFLAFETLAENLLWNHFKTIFTPRKV
jgi:hypothetical protein